MQYIAMWILCIDTDECTEGLHKCSDQSTCVNTLGSYKCVSADCPPGYKTTRGECTGKHPSA